MTTSRLRNAFLMALKSSKPDMESTSFALAAFASNSKAEDTWITRVSSTRFDRPPVRQAGNGPSFLIPPEREPASLLAKPMLLKRPSGQSTKQSNGTRGSKAFRRVFSIVAHAPPISLAAKPFYGRREVFQKQGQPTVLFRSNDGVRHANPDPQFDLPPLRPNIHLRSKDRRRLK